MEPKRTITVRMPVELHRKLKKLAHQREWSMEGLVRGLIEQATFGKVELEREKSSEGKAAAEVAKGVS